MGDRVPAPDAMEHVPVGTNQDMASKKSSVEVSVRGPVGCHVSFGWLRVTPLSCNKDHVVSVPADGQHWKHGTDGHALRDVKWEDGEETSEV